MRVKTPEQIEANLRNMRENITSALLPMMAKAIEAEKDFKKMESAIRELKKQNPRNFSLLP